MAVKKADIYEHNNPNNAFVDSDFLRGGRRSVADLTALYALSTKSDQLKENVTIVYVVEEDKDYKLVDDTQIGVAAGWAEYTTGGGGGSALTVTNGTTSVEEVSQITFTGAIVSGDGAGLATVSGLVPYTGATQNVDLGQHQLSTGQVTFDQSPTQEAGVGVLRWNDTDGTLDLGLKGGNVTLQVGQEEVIRIVNKTDADLLESDFRAVRIRTVAEGGAQGQRLAVVLAQANSDNNSATTIGLVTENITKNQEGFVTTAGNVNGIDTTGAKSFTGTEDWQDGDVLYLDPDNAGYLTNIKPITPAHLIVIGYVEYAHAVNGKIYVKVDNGYELEELHDVLITDVEDKEILQWNATDSYWQNATLAEAGIQRAGNYIPSDITGLAGADVVTNIISLTQAEYNEIATHDASTIYNITDAPFPGLQAVVDDTTPQLGGDLDALNNSISNVDRLNGTAVTTIISDAALGATATQPDDDVSTLINDAGYTSMSVDTAYTDLIDPSEDITFDDTATIVTEIIKRNISLSCELTIISTKDYSRQLLKLKSTGNSYLITLAGVTPRNGVSAVIDDSVADLIHIFEFFGDGTYDYNLQEA